MSLLKRKSQSTQTRLRKSFTFHYVSIKTYMCLTSVRMFLKFTFHYVSIKTHQPETEKSCTQLHLHSTMSLLKQLSSILISTAPDEFTFHYVSIKTMMNRQAQIQQMNLHSTMSLLKHSFPACIPSR